MTKSQAALLALVVRKAKFGGTPPTRRDLARLCEWARQLDAELAQADRETRYVGSTARAFTTIIERIAAGDPVKATVEDFGWEWNRGPSLDVLVRLIALREAVRAWKRAREAESGQACAADAMLKALKRAGGAGRRG